MWKKVICEELKLELLRLQAGNKLERQRYENAEEAISRVMTEPVLNGDGKHGLANYKAADVLAQYRLFYEVISTYNVVHFVWINNEKYIHDNSKDPDPCYDRFLTLIQTNKLAKYIPPAAGKIECVISGSFGVATHIHARYTDTSHGKANSFLAITTEDKKTYHLQSISADPEDQGLEDILLGKVIAAAKGTNTILQFELDKERDPFQVRLLTGLLKRHKFIYNMTIDEVELWELECK